MNFILVVCIGNICRSPMAEGLLSRALPGLRVESAGIGALIGHKADPTAIALMKEIGIDIHTHVARQINQSLCLQADLVLVMDVEQKRYIESRYPSAVGKVYLLTESLKRGVPDPYRKDRSNFEIALSLIDQGAKSWIAKIEKVNARKSSKVT